VQKRESICQSLLHFQDLRACRVKAAFRMLMKLTPRVNSINILCTYFSYESKLNSFSLITFSFATFWRLNISKKVMRKMLVKFTPATIIRSYFFFVDKLALIYVNICQDCHLAFLNLFARNKMFWVFGHFEKSEQNLQYFMKLSLISSS